MKIRPLSDRVVVRRKEEERKSPGGILLPESASGDKPTQGEVVYVGNGKIGDDGKVRPVSVSPGDTILFGKYSGNDIKLDGEELLILREDDIMGVIEA